MLGMVSFVVQEEAKRLAAEAAADGLAANLAEVREALEEAVAMEKKAKAAIAAAAEEEEEERAPASATALAEAAMAARQAATRDAQERVEAFSTALKAIEVRRAVFLCVCVGFTLTAPPHTALFFEGRIKLRGRNRERVRKP